MEPCIFCGNRRRREQRIPGRGLVDAPCPDCTPREIGLSAAVPLQVCQGDCAVACPDRVCTVNRYLAQSACSGCGEPIGVEVPLVLYRRGSAHAACFLERICNLFVPTREALPQCPSLQESRVGMSSSASAAIPPDSRTGAGAPLERAS